MVRTGYFITLLFCIITSTGITKKKVMAQPNSDSILLIKKTSDFVFNKHKIDENWSSTQWVPLTRIKGKKKKGYNTKVKILYSTKGIYFLFECKDKVLNADFQSDFEKLWTQDVVEVFIWPDEDSPDYFEYEISPLNHELILLISDRKGYHAKWKPFLYHSGDIRTRHQTLVKGGRKKSNAEVKKWFAKIFIPYQLLPPLNNTSPKKGTKWCVNFYRIDYDKGETSWWAWQPVSNSFHEYKKFGSMVFE